MLLRNALANLVGQVRGQLVDPSDVGRAIAEWQLPEWVSGSVLDKDLDEIEIETLQRLLAAVSNALRVQLSGGVAASEQDHTRKGARELVTPRSVLHALLPFEDRRRVIRRLIVLTALAAHWTRRRAGQKH